MNAEDGRFFALAFGRLLKETRHTLGLTQETAAQRVGITQSQWSTRESGHRSPHVKEAVKFALRLKVDPLQFFNTLIRYRDEEKSQ